MDQDSLLSLLQFSDGLFPAGGFAHSFGLESYVQSGMIRTTEELKGFIHAYLEGSVGPCDAVALVSAMKMAREGDLESCLALDQRLDAMKSVSEFREASRQMGRQSLRVAASLVTCPLLQAFCESAEMGHTPGHHPLAFGLIGSQLRWHPEAAATAYLYTTTSLLVGASLRLLPVGQLEGQKIVWETAPIISRLAREAKEKGADDLWSFAPAIEIAGMKHATLEARLFRS